MTSGHTGILFFGYYSRGLALPARCSNLNRGGVPGGVLDGELASGSEFIDKGGMQPKQTLLGQGPKFIPPQLLHGGEGGGVHGVERDCGAGV